MASSGLRHGLPAGRRLRPANLIEELTGEPRIPVDEQIQRARDVVEDKSQEELDGPVAGLFAKPTVASAGKAGAAKLLYEPGEAR